jgi:hypothetical protein
MATGVASVRAVSRSCHFENNAAVPNTGILLAPNVSGLLLLNGCGATKVK